MSFQQTKPSTTRVGHTAALSSLLPDLAPEPGAPPKEPHLLLALLLQVHLHLQRLAGLQEGLAVLAVCHVVGRDAHDDGAEVQKDTGQDLHPARRRREKHSGERL